VVEVAAAQVLLALELRVRLIRVVEAEVVLAAAAQEVLAAPE
jgi:hypothetical protein